MIAKPAPQTGTDSSFPKASGVMVSGVMTSDVAGAGRASETDIGAVCRSVAELASGIFDMPLVLIKLFADGTLVTRAAVGVAVSPVLDDMAFTQRKLVPGEGLIVNDATTDGRFFLEAAVLASPKIRFYADMPLVSEGTVIGVLAVAERSPRQDFGPQKQHLLRQFAATVSTTLSLALSAVERQEMVSALKAQETRFDAVQQMTGAGHWSIDLKTREVTWSRGLYGIFGISPKTYKPKVSTQLEVYDPKDAASIIDRFQRAVNFGEDFDFEARILRRRDKVERLIRTKGGVEYDDQGKPVRLCGVVRDITDGEGPVAAPVADVAKTDFLAHVTEELKTPLEAILNYARLLNDKSLEHPDIAGYSQNLLKSATALKGLISDSFDVSGIEATTRTVPARTEVARGDTVNVVALIKDVVNQFAPQAAMGETRLTANFVDLEAPFAEIDSLRLRQVMQNLISNACKFTRGGVVTVTASRIVSDNGPSLRVSVRDTGIGLAEDQSLNIFAGEGGLGLSTCKAIIDMLGGQIGVVSRIGEGSNFWFEIPALWSERRDGSASTDEAQALMPRLVNEIAARSAGAGVDTDRINREYLKALLTSMKLG